MPISTINSNSIGNGTVIAADILDGTISSSKLVSANIAGDRIAANTLSNTVFQTGSVENYLRGANLDFGMRNRIINGAMRIDQRNSGAAITPTDGQYSVDRWCGRLTQASKYTVQQDSSANTVAGFTSSLKATSSSSYSVTSGDFFAIEQWIEGFNTADLGWGTANAKPVTLSFWVRSSLTGTFGGSLRTYAGNQSYPFSYTINAANTWEYETITITGATAGTWNTANSGSIGVAFSLGAGSSYSGTAGAWTGSGLFQPTGSVSIVGTNGATLYVTGVQLEEGSVPTPFEYRQYGTELQLCQRYYEIITGNSDTYTLQGAFTVGTSYRSHWFPKVNKRTAPTFAILSGTSWGGATPSVYTTIDDVAFHSGSTFYFLNCVNGQPAASLSAEL